GAIAAAVADAGMRAWLEHEEPIPVTDDSTRRRRGLVWLSGGAFVAGLIVDVVGGSFWAARTLFAVSIAAGAALTVRRAWSAARVRSLDINVLMMIAATGAIVLGEWSEAAAVVFLFSLAQTLEARTLERARTAIRALMDLTPTEAVVRDATGERPVA